MEKKELKLKTTTPDKRLHILTARFLRVRNIELPKPLPDYSITQKVFSSIEEYLKQYKKVKEIKKENSKRDGKAKQQQYLLSAVEKQIIQLIPVYVWFVVYIKGKQYAVGIDSDDWGGMNYNLHIEEYSKGETLRDLHHNIIR